MKTKKNTAVILVLVLTFAICSMNVCAAQNNETVMILEDITGVGEGVSNVPPENIDITIQPYGSSPPAYGGPYQSLNSGAYSGTVTWMSGYLYSNSWFGTSTTTISLYSDMSIYLKKQDAINQENVADHLGTTSTAYRLVCSNGEKTEWKYIRNNISGTVDFTVTPDMTYYLEICPVFGYYTSGSFSISRK